MFELSQLRVFTEPQQGATYDDLLAVAQAAERLGFGAFFRSDHYLAMGAALERGGLPGPTDSWVTLAGLARETSTIRLGTLVTSATFRLPGPLAISVAQVDQMSGGRVELGLGAGWYEAEHRAYGIPFPASASASTASRSSWRSITGLWATPAGEPFAYDGDALPGRSTRRRCPSRCRTAAIPVIVGGGGPKRTPALAARYAAEYNLRSRRSSGSSSSASGSSPPARRSTAIRRRCGSPPRPWCASARDEAEYARRAAAIDRQPDELRANGVAGTPDEARETLAPLVRRRCRADLPPGARPRRPRAPRRDRRPRRLS